MSMHLLRVFFAALIAISLLGAAGGCSWMGRTAGKAQAKVERNVKSMEEGYQEGYETERAKDQPKG